MPMSMDKGQALFANATEEMSCLALLLSQDHHPRPIMLFGINNCNRARNVSSGIPAMPLTCPLTLTALDMKASELGLLWLSRLELQRPHVLQTYPLPLTGLAKSLEKRRIAAAISC